MKKFFILLVIAISASVVWAQSPARCGHQGLVLPPSTIDSIDVTHYNINLDIVYLSTKSISGYTDLKITTAYTGISRIELQLLRLTVDSVIVDNQINSLWNYNDTILDFPLANSIGSGDTIDVRVYYHGQPKKDPSGWGGFYFSNDSLFAFNLGIGMQDDPHNYGRVWFPAVDNFTDRATYEMNIKVKNGNVAICNGTLESVSSGNSTKTYQWKLHDDIPAYLAMVAVGPYVAVRDTFNGLNANIPIAIYVRPSQQQQAQTTFTHLKQILAAYEDYFGPYRWERVGYVGVPFNSGAMEHATSITIGQGYINGTLNYESLYAHELSHHWFGDLVTCASEGDMWLNEGWAVFCESAYREQVYGKDAYKDNMRALLYDVLKNTHKRDGGYYALANIPHNLTYGSTIYDKGGTVAHSLRGYLGDDKFFSMLHAWFAQKAFTAQSINDFRDFITSYTGINVTDFFNSWVDEPGFSQFAIDSFTVLNNAAPYQVRLWVHQRLNHKPNYALNNRLPVSFMDKQWERLDTVILFSGATGTADFNLNFRPSVVYCDLNETFADATTDYAQTIKSTGLKDYPLSFAKVDVKNISDSVLMQITHNWVGPDSTGISYPGLRISSTHYWTLKTNDDSKINAKLSVHYLRAQDFDADIIKNKKDSLVIFYRENGSSPWKAIKSTVSGSWIAGYVNVENARSGDYVLAAYDYHYLGLKDAVLGDKDIRLKVNPNPAQDKVHFELNQRGVYYLEIYDTAGRQLDRLKMQASTGKTSSCEWNATNYEPGSYIIMVLAKDMGVVYKTKVIISR